MSLMAEGFSSSIARALEKADIDMLHNTVVDNREYTLQVTNEALETHAIRFADLLVFQRDKDARILATPDGMYYSSHTVLPPDACIAPEGDCLSRILNMDQDERFSTADPEDLTRKETIDVTFSNVPKGKFGLLIGSRQTLMTTFLFYQGLAHAGSRMTSYLAQVESGNTKMQRYLTRVWDLLGGIEIFVRQTDGPWVKAGVLDEMGPITADLQWVALPEMTGDDLSVRLRLTQGLWRIDRIALAKLDEEVYPLRLKPVRVMKDYQADKQALIMLNDTANYLTTFPRDRYDLVYELPEFEKEYEIFLYTKGYYLEWMRDEWMREESSFMMAMMFSFPEYYLKLMAPQFKEVESQMEESFWNSRYVKN